MKNTLTASATAGMLLLGSCASFSPDGGFGPVADMTRERSGQAVAWQRDAAQTQTAQARVAELLAAPLSADRAVEVALLNNRGLQAQFFALGIAEADLVRAGRLANPSFSFGRLSGGGVTEIDRSIMVNLLGLLTLPAARQVAQQRFAQAQLQAAFDAVGLANEVRRAFFSAVAAQDLLRYHAQVKHAAEATSELARRMLQAGNFNKLAQMRQQAFDADATVQLARAQHQVLAERERLVRLLGLSGEQLRFMLPERLPDLPAEPLALQGAEQTAMHKRLDVLMAKRDTEATAQALGLTRATRLVNILHAGVTDKRQTGEARQRGVEIELELPLFDFGQARSARAEAVYMQSVQRAADVAITAASEVRESHAAYLTAYQLARHYRDQIVPLKQRIADENLLRYNGMLIGVFELLADAREQVASVTGAIEALREHWIAETQLQTALTGRSPAGGLSLSPSSSSRRLDAAGDAAH
ncbi:TolC family protein [Aquabacterium sp.]|uniref:TolC family protein n=1 Tax=Aquabacterium sp. TaxID=1872578 RepID=UPI002BC233AF|nr:TolC family protein [Aquabacterium sp.]HSW08679.1 TolC family protein [Aquabacterium sp.]